MSATRTKARVLGTLGLLLGVLLIPALVGGVLDGKAGAYAAALGSFLTFVVALGSGQHIARLAAPAVVVVSGAASLVGGTWAWVALLGAVGVVAGGLSRAGLLAPGALVGVAACAVPAAAGPGPALAVALLAALGAGIALLLLGRLQVPARTAQHPADPRAALLTAVLLGATAAVAGWIALGWDRPHASWLPMTVFLIANPSAGLLLHHRSAQRVLGTVVAVGACLLLLALPLPAWVRIGLGLGCMLLALLHLEPLWLNVALGTSALLLLVDPAGTSPQVEFERLSAVVLAALLVLAAMAVAALVDRRWPYREQAREAVELYARDQDR